MIMRVTESTSVNWNVSTIVEMVASKRIDLEIPQQRGKVWRKLKSSLYINSIIVGVFSGVFYFNYKTDENIYECLDGQQRITAMCSYKNDEFALSKETPSVEYDGKEMKIANLKFSQLPKTLQNRIDQFCPRIEYKINMTEEEVSETIKRINSGTPFAARDVARMDIKSRDVIKRIKLHPAIQKGINLVNRRRFQDEDMIGQIWYLCYTGNTSLLSKDIGAALEEQVISIEQEQEIMVFLDNVFELFNKTDTKSKEDRRIFRKLVSKAHLPLVGYAAYIANEKGVGAEEFIERMIRFFNTGSRTATVSELYNEKSREGSAKAPNVKIRMDEIQRALVAE